MDRRLLRGVVVLGALALFAVAEPAEAQERRGPRPTHVAGEMGIRPFLGATGDLNIHGIRPPPPVAGNVLVLGADLYIGSGTGMAYALGLHMGMGDATLYLHPLFEVHYRFETPIPLVPWVGGGAGMKFGFRANQAMNLALTFRFVTGIEYFITDTIGVGMQLAIPDLGPRLLPSILPIGNIEWIIGPHFRF
jgi:hypothetical protein